MDNYDIKKARKALYAPTAKDFTLVDVPPITFVMVDGHGDPNTVPAYLEAVQALFTVSYAVRALARKPLAASTRWHPWRGCGRRPNTATSRPARRTLGTGR